MPASKTSWKREPFKQCVPIQYHAAFDADQLVHLKAGLIPQAMEDKWFIYFEELFFHRSWTGHTISTIVAIFLAKVRRAISGLIPLATKAV